MPEPKKPSRCPCCDPTVETVEEALTRRRFLKTASGAVVTAAGLGALPWSLPPKAWGAGMPFVPPEDAKPRAAEDYVKLLFENLKPEQRREICFPIDHPLRKKVSNNWHIVPQLIKDYFTADQQEIIRSIFKGVTTEDGYERFQKQMKDDSGGFGEYSCALFGSPAEGKYQWVMTGRHLTLRADGNTIDNVALGGPIFYGHAVTFNEKPDHPGNVWWHQARLANEVFQALDGKQRDKALLEEPPADEEASVRLRGSVENIPGLAVAELAADQKALLEKTLKSLLAMLRESDVNEVMECLKKNGGLESARVSFYKNGDLGSDGIWDIWRVEGPAFVWFFRGAPHVHTWVNVAHRGQEWI
ncbi:MAG: DUF3500 domain-containing protein [Planctomycetes bacterium]|nr:DUF3500 domain-containing protein [Planctomycetota bacterium]